MLIPNFNTTLGEDMQPSIGELFGIAYDLGVVALYYCILLIICISVCPVVVLITELFCCPTVLRLWSYVRHVIWMVLGPGHEGSTDIEMAIA
ncbi:unnamed protein product [Auanema sp. JU1783]|nr:unnamed protein product [Auanema sp. JU1783]